MLTPQQVTSPGWGPCARGKATSKGCAGQSSGGCIKRGCPGSGKALGVRSEAARPGEEATQVTDVTWTGLQENPLSWSLEKDLSLAGNFWK